MSMLIAVEYVLIYLKIWKTVDHEKVTNKISIFRTNWWFIGAMTAK